MKPGKTLAIVTVTSLIMAGGKVYGNAHNKAQKKPQKGQVAMPTKPISTMESTVKNPVVGEVIVKCAGIVKKGKNHCAAGGHQCHGLSAKDPKIKDFDPKEWIYVRKEVCDATPGKVIGQVKLVKG